MDEYVSSFLTVSDVGRRFGVAPRIISDLFYARRLDDQRCPIIAGRRLIPLDYIPCVEAALRAADRLPQSEEAVAHAD